MQGAADGELAFFGIKFARSPATKFITPVRLLWPLTGRDALIDATACTRRPTLVTHNSTDMTRTGLAICVDGRRLAVKHSTPGGNGESKADRKP